MLPFFRARVWSSFFGGRFLPKAKKNLWVEDDSTSPMIRQEKNWKHHSVDHYTYEEPSFHKKSSWDAAKHLSPNCMNWGSWTSFWAVYLPPHLRGKIHHTWLLSSPNITGQFMGLQVFPLSLRYRDKKVNSPFRCAKKRTPRENRTVNILWRMADHKYPHKYRPPACNTGVLKHRNTLTPHGILSRIFVGVIEKSDESRDWNLLKYWNYRWTTAQKFLLTAQIWSRFMTCWDHPHCILSWLFSSPESTHNCRIGDLRIAQKGRFYSEKKLETKNQFFSPPKQQRYVFFFWKKTISICLGGANHKQDYD